MIGEIEDDCFGILPKLVGNRPLIVRFEDSVGLPSTEILNSP